MSVLMVENVCGSGYRDSWSFIGSNKPVRHPEVAFFIYTFNRVARLVHNTLVRGKASGAVFVRSMKYPVPFRGLTLLMSGDPMISVVQAMYASGPSLTDSHELVELSCGCSRFGVYCRFYCCTYWNEPPHPARKALGCAAILRV